MSRFSAAKGAGFALAAVLAGDRELSSVAASVSPEDLVRIRAAGGLDEAQDRASLVAGLLRHVRPALLAVPAGLPVRLSALLAAHLPREQARAVLAAAASTRAGFEPESELLPRLLRIARGRVARCEEPA